MLIVSPHDLSVTAPLLAWIVTANNTFSIVLDDWKGVQLNGVSPYSSAVTPSLGGEVHPDWLLTPDSANLNLSLDIASFPWLKYDAAKLVDR